MKMKQKQSGTYRSRSSHSLCFSTRSRGRTGTTLQLLVFETNASTNSTIRAYEIGGHESNKNSFVKILNISFIHNLFIVILRAQYGRSKH